MKKMSKKAIFSNNAPAAIGPYSQAIVSGNTVYLSGQIPLDPNTSDLVHGDFATHARQVFTNLRAVCEAAGGNMQNIVKLNVYLLDLDNFATVNEVMREYFKEPWPARAAIAVAGLPKGAQVEVDAIMTLA